MSERVLDLRIELAHKNIKTLKEELAKIDAYSIYSDEEIEEIKSEIERIESWVFKAKFFELHQKHIGTPITWVE